MDNHQNENRQLIYLKPKAISTQSEQVSSKPIYLHSKTQSFMRNNEQTIRLNPRDNSALTLNTSRNEPPVTLGLKIAKYHAEHVKTKKGLQELLDILHQAIQNAETTRSMPDTSYLFKKMIGSGLKKSFSFTTHCCGKVMHDIKSMNKIHCPECERKFSLKQIINQKENYSVRLVDQHFQII